MGEIIFLTHRVPWPPNRGDKIRSHHILRKLMEYRPVHLTCFADDEAEEAEESDIKASLASLQIIRRDKSNWLAGIEAVATGRPVSLTSFDSTKIHSYVQGILKARPIDCIFVFSGQMAQFVPADYNGRLVMDFADVDSAKFESYADDGTGPMAWINRREAKLLGAFETQVANRADYSLFVSEAEAQLFRQRSGLTKDKVKAVGNGIDFHFYDPSDVAAVELPHKGPLMVFTGQMDYRPNVEAVLSFSTDVMPQIIKRHADAQFAIVGRAPTDAVRKLDGLNGTMVTGSVDDIRSWIKAADVVVAPLRIARGIQNKVLEAMAMGKPVVASVAAAQGIDAVAGEHLCVANNPSEEAQFVCDLLSNREKAKLLGDSANRLIRSTYSWKTQLADMARLCGIEDDEIIEAAE
ncbi:TIGR03087 family PEP-CTERM/XrtA system glycosyltransferase [Parasphingorhabdus cellanae]|uniref:TIGR03087 family PEP-CTERM/XrtA system glycosyltransferase n=1 Tax=Parasphingorhabdus cellanae TaxID=2806553 RepID=A0ABX7T4J7_9SPHN|nr:TIGR03087 family PEP-CTERM/XrtA system glycosyltransferase [Parasphingorhabdus cellanae]QTD56446.1 TIGR03087 family PEP-CTERM/XrtA system glycosyltransferase [Parasphingorhabdus cellanae]